jgi:glyoxylase-like metal-dependent hydrolase (beta-lactamase superfamily II)
MEQSLITIETGKINEYLFHIDVKAYGAPRMLSIFVAQFDNSNVIIDCGSSLDIKRLLRFLKNLKIDLSSFKYLITTHHHFDHVGGMWKFYEILKDYNPNVKILTNQKTKELLNNYEEHLARGKRTYGNLIGVMKPIEEDAFKLIEPSRNFNSDPNKLDIFDTFTINGDKVYLSIVQTPGHTPDHQSPIFIRNGMIDFIHYGECAGTIYHSSKLITMPTSMPVYFNYSQFMATLANLKNIIPSYAGFGHFGVVNGRYNVHNLLLEHETFLEQFRNTIIKLYKEKPETRYVFEKMLPVLIPRTDIIFEKNSIFEGIALGVVYGMMMDLGYRKD